MILKENMTSIVQRCEKEKEHLTETDGNNGDRVAISTSALKERTEKLHEEKTNALRPNS